MARPAIVHPRWLHERLIVWGRISIARQLGGLGYPSVCPMLQSGIPTQARAFEPFDVAPFDIDELQDAIDKLERKYQLAIVRAYRPDAIRRIEQELAAYSPSIRTWQSWVQTGADMIVMSMEREAA
jgi:hypothetical protein